MYVLQRKIIFTHHHILVYIKFINTYFGKRFDHNQKDTVISLQKSYIIIKTLVHTTNESIIHVD